MATDREPAALLAQGVERRDCDGALVRRPVVRFVEEHGDPKCAVLRAGKPEIGVVHHAFEEVAERRVGERLL